MNIPMKMIMCKTLFFFYVSAASASVPPLTVIGNKIFSGNHPFSYAGDSLFWSNDGWGGEKYYTSKTVFSLKRSWNAGIIRVPMGVEESGGYLQDPVGNMRRVRTVVNTAIYNNMYVVIDFHTSHAELYENVALNFFKEMAISYGKYPNVIFEIYNEPLDVSWSRVVKPYAIHLIKDIRKYSSNLIVVGTPHWSQDVDEASKDPISEKNIAYTLHFYAGTHGQSLREKAFFALRNNIPLFVTEWSSVQASGDGSVNLNETEKWISFLRKNNINNCYWAYNDKKEGASVFYPNTARLTPSGLIAYKNIRTWPYKL